MYDILESATFSRWLMQLKDTNAQGRILARIERMEAGNLGDVKSIGATIHEARIPYGPGYRLYFMRHKRTIIVLLAGGDKASQKQDIIKAKAIADAWEK